MSTIVAPAADRRESGGISDGELVAAVRAGDDRAFERLYERYHRRIAAYVYGMVNDYGRAEDLTQDVFISGLRRMRETERPIAFKPWIYEIAKNACIDQFRRARRAEEVSFDAAETTGGFETGRLAALDGGPDEAVSAKQQLDHLCGAFGGLSDTHHQILVMRELEGLSYREIGEKMGLTRPSVESTLFRARRRLTEEYDELASGERCLRVQSIILTAGGGIGARDRRRMLRHVAHCQPCRREARLAGLAIGSLPRHPMRDVVAAKVAAILPFPFLFRGRRGGGEAEAASPGLVANVGGSLPTMVEPLAGWTKVAVAAATLVVAGAGAGAVSRVVAEDEPAAAAAQVAPAGVESSPDRGGSGDPDRAAGRARAAAGARQRAATGGKRQRAGGGSSGGSANPGPARERDGSGAPAEAPPAGPGAEQGDYVVPVAPATPVTTSTPLDLGGRPDSGDPIVPELRAPASSGNLTEQITDAAGALTGAGG